MGRLLRLLVAAAAIAGIYRYVRRRQADEPRLDDPATELRRRLQEVDQSSSDAPGGEEVVQRAATHSPEERRARVHGRAQDAIDAMRGGAGT